MITLGIIGIVAAITMPTLIANYQKKVWVAQLKKDVNYVLNSMSKILYDEGVDSFVNSSLYYPKDGYVAGFRAEDLNKYLQLEYVPKNSDFYKYASDAGISDSAMFRLKDGSCLGVDNSVNVMFVPSNTEYKDIIPIVVDVNCDKHPNLGGRDRFSFYLNQNAKLIIPDMSLSCKKDERQKEFENMVDQLASATGMSKDDVRKLLLESGDINLDEPGSACFYSVLKDGWEMNY